MSTDKNTADRVLEWHRLGVNPGGIANALDVEGVRLPEGASGWTSDVVRAVLAEQGVNLAEERQEADDAVDWADHCGSFQRPWLGRDGTWRKVDVRVPGDVGTVVKPTNRKD